MKPVASALVTLGFLGVSSVARAGDASASCVADAEAGQRLRDEGKLVEGRARFIRCSAEACPGVVRRECVQWLAEVEPRVPSVVLATRDEVAKDIVGASVVLDGKPLESSVVGREIAINPGPHRLEAAVAGHGRAVESIVVREREKGRSIVLVLPSERAPGARVPDRRVVPVLSWVLGGVAVAGGAGFGFFWSRSLDEVSELRASCAPYCSPDRIDDARFPANVARISGAIGITAAALAVAVYFLTPAAPVRAKNAGTF